MLAFAYKESEGPLTIESEENLIFLGLIAMMDPPRPEAIQAVADAKRAGIRTVMITGDHKITARAIAKQLGIYQEGDLAVTGRELDAMSEKELQEKLEKICVYARVSPEHKIRIVKAWQKKRTDCFHDGGWCQRCTGIKTRRYRSGNGDYRNRSGKRCGRHDSFR